MGTTLQNDCKYAQGSHMIFNYTSSCLLCKYLSLSNKVKGIYSKNNRFWKSRIIFCLQSNLKVAPLPLDTPHFNIMIILYRPTCFCMSTRSKYVVLYIHSRTELPLTGQDNHYLHTQKFCVGIYIRNFRNRQLLCYIAIYIHISLYEHRT